MGMFQYEFSVSKRVKYLIPANTMRLILNSPYLDVSLIEFLSIQTQKVLPTLKHRNDILFNISPKHISFHHTTCAVNNTILPYQYSLPSNFIKQFGSAWKNLLSLQKGSKH